MVRVNCDRLPVNVQVLMFTSPYYGEGFPLGLTVSLLGCCKRATCVGDNMLFLGVLVDLRENSCEADWTCINRDLRRFLWVKIGSDGRAHQCLFQVAD